jgi:hypothetical protein
VPVQLPPDSGLVDGVARLSKAPGVSNLEAVSTKMQEGVIIMFRLQTTWITCTGQSRKETRLFEVASSDWNDLASGKLAKNDTSWIQVMNGLIKGSTDRAVLHWNKALAQCDREIENDGLWAEWDSETLMSVDDRLMSPQEVLIRRIKDGRHEQATTTAGIQACFGSVMPQTKCSRHSCHADTTSRRRSNSWKASPRLSARALGVKIRLA